MFRIAAAALFTCAALAAQSKLLPVDESPSDPQFSKFYQAFRTTVAKKDAKLLMSVLDAEVQNSFGGDGGVKEFEEYWNPRDPNSKVWTELSTIMNLGGSFSIEQGTKTFCAPYVYSKFPDNLEALDHGVIIGINVALRTKPSDSAPVISKLAHDIVKVPSWDPQLNGHWIRVVTRAGAGYVRRSEIRSPGDFRACFGRKAGVWKLRYLIAGD